MKSEGRKVNSEPYTPVLQGEYAIRLPGEQFELMTYGIATCNGIFIRTENYDYFSHIDAGTRFSFVPKLDSPIKEVKVFYNSENELSKKLAKNFEKYIKLIDVFKNIKFSAIGLTKEIANGGFAIDQHGNWSKALPSRVRKALKTRDLKLLDTDSLFGVFRENLHIFENNLHPRRIGEQVVNFNLLCAVLHYVKNNTISSAMRLEYSTQTQTGKETVVLSKEAYKGVQEYLNDLTEQPDKLIYPTPDEENGIELISAVPIDGVPKLKHLLKNHDLFLKINKTLPAPCNLKSLDFEPDNEQYPYFSSWAKAKTDDLKKSIGEFKNDAPATLAKAIFLRNLINLTEHTESNAKVLTEYIKRALMQEVRSPEDIIPKGIDILRHPDKPSRFKDELISLTSALADKIVNEEEYKESCWQCLDKLYEFMDRSDFRNKIEPLLERMKEEFSLEVDLSSEKLCLASIEEVLGQIELLMEHPFLMKGMQDELKALFKNVDSIPERYHKLETGSTYKELKEFENRFETIMNEQPTVSDKRSALFHTPSPESSGSTKGDSSLKGDPSFNPDIPANPPRHPREGGDPVISQ